MFRPLASSSDNLPLQGIEAVQPFAQVHPQGRFFRRIGVSAVLQRVHYLGVGVIVIGKRDRFHEVIVPGDGRQDISDPRTSELAATADLPGGELGDLADQGATSLPFRNRRR